MIVFGIGWNFGTLELRMSDLDGRDEFDAVWCEGIQCSEGMVGILCFRREVIRSEMEDEAEAEAEAEFEAEAEAEFGADVNVDEAKFGAEVDGVLGDSDSEEEEG